jgi:hypothetical protein
VGFVKFNILKAIVYLRVLNEIMLVFSTFFAPFGENSVREKSMQV